MNIIVELVSPGRFFKDAPIHSLNECLKKRGFEVVFAADQADLVRVVENNARLAGVVIDWEDSPQELCQQIHDFNEYLPVFAFSSSNSVTDATFQQLSLNVEFFEYEISNAADIAVTISQKVEEYEKAVTPPLTRALMNFAKEGKYTFCTPGHMSGTAFQHSPVGALFYDFFGANTFKADVSVSVGELGSLLDHSGPHRDAEKYIAETFNADRNCHKSLTHLMMMSNVIPIYLRPTRNAYGILGGIPQSEFKHETIEKRVKETPNATWPVHAVVTNSTYDGLFYNTGFIKNTLDVKSIHFDSAWVPYTNFSPIYQGLAGMSGGRTEGKVIYETQSTHKLLAAFSQASMIHVKGEINEATFNEAFMMHTSTSPFYPIVASTETAAAMMRGNVGHRLIDESIDRAIRFRKEIKRLREESDSWFFDVWQPENIGTKECWELKPEDKWHGFRNIDQEHMYLDPIKVTLLTPGLNGDGTMAERGIPASIVSKYLDDRGVIVEKTGPYNLLFLFSFGIDNTKAMGLLRELCNFRRDYDRNLEIKEAIPSLYKKDPSFYDGMRLQELAQGIHKLIVEHDLPNMMFHAFETLPKMVMTPFDAFQRELNGEVEEVRIQDMQDKVNANMILPYPPGVPLVMPGEMLTADNRAVLDFMLMLCEIGEHFPGFETDIHGAYRQPDGSYTVKVLKM